MLKISRQQLNTRYDSIPKNLKEFLFSETNSDLLWAIGETNHLSDDKKSDLATTVGDVILGFIHPDDLSKHIVADLNIDARLAQTLAGEIEKKIFYSVIQDLRENYRAIGSETPSTIFDISKPEQSEVIYSEFEPRVDLKKEPGEKELGDFFSQLNGNEKGIAKSEEGIVKEAAPTIIHKEEEIKPTTKVKTSFGGLLGIFKGAGEKKSQAQAIMAEVQFSGAEKTQNNIKQAEADAEISGKEEKSLNPLRQPADERGQQIHLNSPADGGGKGDLENKSQQINVPIEAPLRVVHYSDLRTPIVVNSEKVKDEGLKTSPSTGSGDKEKLPDILRQDQGIIKSPNPLLERGQQIPLNPPTGGGGKGDLKELVNNSKEINLDHFGGVMQKTENTVPVQSAATEQKWKPGGMFSFLKKEKVIANNANKDVITQIKNDGELVKSETNGNKVEIGGNTIAEVKSPNPLRQPADERGQATPFIKGGKGDFVPADIIGAPKTPVQDISLNQNISNNKLVESLMVKNQSNDIISNGQPKIINLDGGDIIKETYKSSLNGEQHKIAKEELEKLMSGELVKKDQTMDLKSEGGIIRPDDQVGRVLSGAKNLNTVTGNEIASSSTSRNDKTKEKSGGIFGFFRKKPKLVEIDLDAINKENIANQKLAGVRNVEAKQVDYKESDSHVSQPAVSVDNLVGANKQPEVVLQPERIAPAQDRSSDTMIKAIDSHSGISANEIIGSLKKSDEGRVKSDVVNKENIVILSDQIPNSKFQIPIQAQPNIENIQLKDLPVNEDVIDLRNL